MQEAVVVALLLVLGVLEAVEEEVLVVLALETELQVQ
jgi:hypothetical protein